MPSAQVALLTSLLVVDIDYHPSNYTTPKYPFIDLDDSIAPTERQTRMLLMVSALTLNFA